MKNELVGPGERIDLMLIKSALENQPFESRYRDIQSLKRYLFEMAVEIGDNEVAQLLFGEMERSFEYVAAMHLVSQAPELLQESVTLLKDRQQKDIKDAFSDDTRNPKTELLLSRDRLLGHIAVSNTLSDSYVPGELIGGVSLEQKELIFDSEANNLLAEGRIDEYRQALRVFLSEYKRYFMGVSEVRPPLLYLVDQLQRAGNPIGKETGELLQEAWIDKFEGELKVNKLEDEIANAVYATADWKERIPGKDEHSKSARLVLHCIALGVDLQKLAHRHASYITPVASEFNSFVINLRNSQFSNKETEFRSYITILGKALAERAETITQKEEILAIAEQSSIARDFNKPTAKKIAEHEFFNLIAPPPAYDFDLRKRKEVERYFENATIEEIDSIEDLQVKISGLIYKIYYEKRYDLVDDVREKISKVFDENQRRIYTMGLAFLVYLERYDSQIRDK